MLGLRIATALIGLPIVISILVYGSQLLLLGFYLFCLSLAVYEAAYMILPRLDELFARLESTDSEDAAIKARRLAVPPHERRRNYIILGGFCVTIAAAIFLASALGHDLAGRSVLLMGLIVAILVGVFATRGIDAEMARMIGFIVSLVYAGLPWLAVWDLHRLGTGSRYVFLLLAIVWAGDTGGYFGGRFFGSHKLAPHKSPKKTWEGAVAGLCASVVASLGINCLYQDPLASNAVLIAIGLGGGLAGQLGDLVESVIKRFTRVKDSGAILPGHGGFLDRTDGILFAAPVIWFILFFFGGLRPTF